MPRIRSIKPETFSSETLSECSIPARWTFAGLWTYCDDKGRGKAEPRLIKAALYPLDDEMTVEVVEGHLRELEHAGVVCRYSVGDKRLLHVVNFREHQHPSKPQPSKFPECPGVVDGGPPDGSHTVPEPLPERSGNGQGLIPVGVVEEGSRKGGVEEGSATALRDGSADRDDIERLCTRLADRIEANGSKRPRVTQGWRDAARLLLDRDGRTEAQVAQIIDWSQQDGFWRKNILSMPKLREKYDQLRLNAEDRSNGRGLRAVVNDKPLPGGGWRVEGW